MSSPPETRASLILRLPDADDAAAWEEFENVYGPLVYRLARKQGLQTADADDLVQEVLSAVSQSVKQWLARSDRGKFRAWLFRIARNTSINFLTRVKHRPLGTGDDKAIEFLDDAFSKQHESDEFDIECRREVFRWASEKVQEMVNESTWQAFWQTSVADRPILEVAEELGMTVGNIYIARSRVMARLQELVRQFEEAEA